MPQPWPLVLLIALGPALSGCWNATAVQFEDGVVESKPTKGGTARYTVQIRTPVGPPVVETGLRDRTDKAVTVSCQHCHATRSPNRETRATAELDQFHQGLQLNHGQRTCVACHNPLDGYGSLHLADGKAVDFADVMTLCAQCHGPQYRDYQHGSHGGMNGYWDLSRGPRQRNNCIDCHDPHAPQFPRVQPAPGPQHPALPTSSASKAPTHE